jgi:5'(3')-deoxyribonucleotidase
MQEKNLTVFVDMDEVIADAYGAHIEIYNRDFNENLSVHDCMGYDAWLAVPPDRHDSVRGHARNSGFFRDLKPIADSQEVMEALHEKYDVYIASAAMEFPNSLIEKSEWLDQHFPFIHWKKRILCGHKHILKGDILIDDRTFNLEPFEGRKILFTSPHNVHITGYERADSWKDIARMLL